MFMHTSPAVWELTNLGSVSHHLYSFRDQNVFHGQTGASGYQFGAARVNSIGSPKLQSASLLLAPGIMWLLLWGS